MVFSRVPFHPFDFPVASRLAAAAFCCVHFASAENVKPASPALEQSFRDDVEPIFENYCFDCHADGIKKGELTFDRYDSIESMIADRDVWKRIRNHIDFRLMPPPDEDAPDDEERKKMIAWIDAAVFPVDPNHPDPGHVTLRRLNRVEYKNTIRDLLGVDVNVDELLPSDDSGYGFDNIGDVLTLSPVHLERYLDTAQIALEKAIDLGPRKFPQESVAGKRLNGPGQRSDRGHYLISNGAVEHEFRLGEPGRYRIRVTASADAAKKEPAKMDLRIDDKTQITWEVSEGLENPKTFETEVTFNPKGGSAKIAAVFTNDFYDPENPDPTQRDRNLMIHRISVEGPLDGPYAPRPATHRRIYVERQPNQSDDAYMRDVLNRFARRAFRRPVENEEIERYLVFNQIAKTEGATVEVAIRHALEAMLASPAFLFREEPGVGETQRGRKLISEHALATRLSYFLWSTMPDDELFQLADAGELRKNLDREIRRMIADEKASAFTENFAGQWLQLRNLSSAFPNYRLFRSFYDNKLAGLMKKETEMLFENVLKENLPVSTLLTADYTFINETLANHYGIPGVTGKEFQKVSLANTPRRGLFGQGSFLTLTSYPTRTSPVLRGQYVLENILDTPAPPPPPNVPQLTAPEGQQNHGLSLRQQMEKHRDDPGCASCHALMDPIGFGMENFDAIGRWRDQENGIPIDPAGKLVTGQSFATAQDLMKILSEDNKKQFHHAIATKLLTYALGRGVDWYDRPAIDGIVLKAQTEEGRFIDLIKAVIDSVPFQYRRG
jgi:hypothetical protein